LLGFAASALFVFAGLALSGTRVLQLERAELDYESPPRSLAQLADAPGSTRVSARIAEIDLDAGKRVLFELCTQDQLAESRWLDALELAVFRQPDLEVMLHRKLDRATLSRARRSARGACLQLGGGLIERAGHYTLDAVWPENAPAPELMSVPLRARVLGRPPLAARDRLYVVAIGLGVLLSLASAMTLRRGRIGDAATTPVVASGALRALPALIAIALLVAATQLPAPGSTFTFVKGLVLVLIQAGSPVLCAGMLARTPRHTTLALDAPARALPWSFAALAAAFLLYASARLALRFTPTTGEAPIQTFVSWPSGMLCFAALGIVLPVGEEVFFRGYLYRAALALGRVAAFLLTWLLFVALHAEQSWGNWGGLVSIALVGAVLTALRAASGSALIPAIAHVLYNFALSMASF
jgi:membrane protease YdiL (CAAX protease family)